MNKLLEGYDHRIKKFVLKMAEKPIVLKNNTDKHMTTRQELYASSSNKILDKKGFLFKSYKSDKERINEVIKNKEILDKYLAKNYEKKQKQKFLEKINVIKFMQPSMHFKKRSGIEKIDDIFKKKHHLNEEQKLLYNQLIRMGLVHSSFIKHEYEEENENRHIFGRGKFNSTDNIFEKNKLYHNIISNDSLTDEEKYKKILHDKILNERKNMLLKRKLLLSVGNRIKNINKITSNQINENELQKTYFKAMENLAIFKTSNMNHKLFKEWSMEDFEKQHNINESNKKFYKTISTNFYKNEKSFKQKHISNKKDNMKYLKLNSIEINDTNLAINKNKMKLNSNNQFNLTKYNDFSPQRRKSNFDLMSQEKILKDLEIKNEIISTNPLLFKLNFKNDMNDDQNKKAENTISFEKLNNLKKIAFENGEEENNETVSEEELDSYYEDYKKDDNIIIDGNYYNKNDIDKIAVKVLKKCNWNDKKINYKNMDGRHKLMFTNGLTVKEFELKYGILP